MCDSGIAPRDWVVVEMQAVASSTPGSTRAPVGQASRHSVQEPQPGGTRSAAGSSSASVTSAPRATNEPWPGTMASVFLP